MPKEAFSAADPDGPAYAATMAKEKRLRAEREAQQQQKISGAADLTDKVLDRSQRAAETLGTIGQDEELMNFARKYGKLTGPAGVVLSAMSKRADFQADRARGVPLDEAFVKHGGRYALELAGGAAGSAVGATTGGALGALAGSEVPVVGNVAGGLLGAGIGGFAGSVGGAYAGEYGADRIAAGYRRLKRGETGIQRHIYELTDPMMIMQRYTRGLPPLRPAF